MTVPLARGVATRTTSWTGPEAPASGTPTGQLPACEASEAPPVADTNVVFAGTVASALPVFEFSSVYVLRAPASFPTRRSSDLTARTGAELTVVVIAAPLIGDVSAASML